MNQHWHYRLLKLVHDPIVRDERRDRTFRPGFI